MLGDEICVDTLKANMTDIIHFEESNSSQQSESSESVEDTTASTINVDDGLDIKPDETGPRACLVVVSLFVIVLIESGIIRGFGVLVDDLVLQFETDIGIVGFVIGLSNGISYIIAPFIAPFSNRKTFVRPMMVIGSVIMGVAISMASLASSVVGFAVAMATSGVGYALVMLPSVVIFNRYFTKHFAMALGIIEIGSSLSLVFPLVTEKLLEATGMRGTILLFGGISLNMVVCSALLRDPRTLGKKGSPRTKIIKKGTSCAEDSDRNEDSMRSSTFHERHKGCPQEDSTLLHRNQNTHDDVRDCQISDFDRENGVIRINSTVTTTPTNRDEHGKKQVLRSKSQKSKNPEHMVITVLLRPFRWLWCFLDLSLCRDEPFLNCIYLATSFFAMVHTAWYIFFVPHALAKGITLSNAVLINLIAGVGEMVGAFFQGLVIGRGWMTSLGLFMMMSLLNSVVFFLDPLLSNVMLLAGAGFVNGFFLGGSLTLTSVMLKDTVSQARFATSYGLSSLTYGIAGPIGGYTAGWIASLVGYEMAFVFLGGMSSAILLAMIPAYFHFKRSKDQMDYRETPV